MGHENCVLLGLERQLLGCWPCDRIAQIAVEAMFVIIVRHLSVFSECLAVN